MRTSCILIAVVLLLTIPVVVSAQSPEIRYELIADGGSALTEIDVGDVVVSLVGNSLYVKYEVDDPWGLTETHVCVKEALADIPQQNDNPIPGKFRKEETGEGREYDPPVSEDTYVIDVTGLDLSKLYIAAHAVVLFESDNSIYVADSILIAGATAEATLVNPGTGDMSYFDVFVSASSSQYLKNGTYPGFCVDTDVGLTGPIQVPPYHGPFGPFIVLVYSSYDPNLPECVIDVPENLDLVNWILTRDYVGDSGPCGPYTYGDVQVAIWLLIEDNIPGPALDPEYLGPTCEDNIDQIVQDAQAYGEGFVPGGSDKYGLILVPVDYANADPPNMDPCEPVAQIFMIVVQASGDETAWGAIPKGYPLDGDEWNEDPDDSYAYDFRGSNWAHYIIYPHPITQAPPRTPARGGVVTTWGKLKL